MPLTREQTKYQSTNDTVFFPTVAIDRNLAVRGTSVFDGTVTFNGTLITPAGTGSAGQYLESTGTGVRWTSVSGYSAPTIGSTLITSGSTNTTIAGLTLTSPTLNTPTLTLATASSTTDARISWDTTYKKIQVGNGTTSLDIFPLAVNTTAKLANYQLTTADANTIVQMNGAFAFQVDTSLAVLPLGTQITLVAQTTGVTVATTANATVPTINATPGLKLRAAWSSATLIKMSASSASGTASTWLLTGDLTA